MWGALFRRASRRHRGLNQDDRCFFSRSFSRRAGFVSFALCFAACSRLHFHALRHGNGTPPQGRCPNLRPFLFRSRVCRRLFCRFYFFRRLRQRGRLFLAPESRPTRPDRRRPDPSLRPSPHRRAHQAQSPRRNHRRRHPRRTGRRRFPAPRPALCRPRRFPFFLSLAHRLFRPFHAPPAQSPRPPPPPCPPTSHLSP